MTPTCCQKIIHPRYPSEIPTKICALKRNLHIFMPIYSVYQVKNRIKMESQKEKKYNKKHFIEMYTNNMKDDQIVLFKGLQKPSVDFNSVLELTFLDSPVLEA